MQFRPRVYSFLLILTVVLGCTRKELNETDPAFSKVVLSPAKFNPDGSIAITATIIQGAEEVTKGNILYGYHDSINSLPFADKPRSLDGKTTWTQTFGGNFAGVPGPLYFRAYVIDRNGFQWSNQITVDSVVLPEVPAPCSNPVQMMDLGNGETPQQMNNYTYYVPTSDDFRINATGGRFQVNFYFPGGEPFLNKVYKVPDDIRIPIYIDGQKAGDMVDGTEVYVNWLGGKRWHLEICGQEWETPTFQNRYTLNLNLTSN